MKSRNIFLLNLILLIGIISFTSISMAESSEPRGCKVRCANGECKLPGLGICTCLENGQPSCVSTELNIISSIQDENGNVLADDQATIEALIGSFELKSKPKIDVLPSK